MSAITKQLQTIFALLSIIVVVPSAVGERPESGWITPNERTVSFVSIRETPSTGSIRLIKLSKGENAELIETLPLWYKVRYKDNIEGYVLKNYTMFVMEQIPDISTPDTSIVQTEDASTVDSSTAPTDFDYMAKQDVGVKTSLEQAIEITLNTNPDILSQANERLAVDEEVTQAMAGYFPSVDINGGYGWEKSDTPSTRASGDGSVSLTREELGIFGRQMLFDGFATRSEVERQRARVNSRAFSVFRIAELTALRVTNTYLNILRQRKLVELAQENLIAHQRILEQVQLRSERGVGRKSDLDQILGRVALAESNLRAEEGNLKDAETGYLSVVGEMPTSLSRPGSEFRFLPANVEDAVQLALEDNPTLKSAMADIEAAKAQHAAAKSPLLPRLDLEVGANLNHDIDGVEGRNKDAFAMVRLRYNIFAGGGDIARRRETTKLTSQAIEIKNSTYRQVEESMRLSWSAYQTVQDQIDDFRQHVESSEGARNAYKQQFNIGQRTLLDLLDQENEVFVSRIAYVNSRYDLIFAKYRVLTGMGKLLASFEIELPEEAKELQR